MARQELEVRRRTHAMHVEPSNSLECVSRGEARFAGLASDERVADDGDEARRAAIVCIVTGAVLAPLFAFAPIVRIMGWFLSSLVHEMGHAATGWFFGAPSVPAISLEGHAAAMHGDQSWVLVFMVWGGLCFFAFRATSRPAVWLARVGAVAVYPVIAFTSLAELLQLVGGHGAEILFSVVCLGRATIRDTGSMGERIAYAALGWYLLGHNLALTGGLLFSEAARARYATSGSFGLVNDYLLVAGEFAGGSLATVALAMSLVALAAPFFCLLLVRSRSA